MPKNPPPTVQDIRNVLKLLTNADRKAVHAQAVLEELLGEAGPVEGKVLQRHYFEVEDYTFSAKMTDEQAVLLRQKTGTLYDFFYRLGAVYGTLDVSVNNALFGLEAGLYPSSVLKKMSFKKAKGKVQQSQTGCCTLQSGALVPSTQPQCVGNGFHGKTWVSTKCPPPG